jgi:NAD+ synthase (glutamine-hydrolysing)
MGPACWLWNYLRRLGAGGFFLPLSGGADSAATCAIVGIMCDLVVRACLNGDKDTIVEVQKVTGQTKKRKGCLVNRIAKAQASANPLSSWCYL